MLTQRLGVLAHDFTKQCRLSSSISRTEEKTRESKPSSCSERYHTKRSEQLRNYAMPFTKVTECSLFRNTAKLHQYCFILSIVEDQRNLHDFYQLGETIGNGGFGAVYAGVSRLSGDSVSTYKCGRSTQYLPTLQCTTFTIGLLGVRSEDLQQRSGLCNLFWACSYHIPQSPSLREYLYSLDVYLYSWVPPRWKLCLMVCAKSTYFCQC